MAILKFVLLKRSKIHISPKHPTLSSSAPLGFLVLLTMLIATLGFVTSYTYVNTPKSWGFPTSIGPGFIVNPLLPISVFLIFAVSSENRCWIVLRTIFYLLIATSCAIVNILVAVEEFTGKGLRSKFHGQLDTSSHLYMIVCPSIGPSVRWLVGPL